MTGDQLQIDFSRPRLRRESPAESTLYDRRFAEFDRENPHVYAELLRLARRARTLGRRKIGMRMLWEVTRWNLDIETQRPEGEFKLNDHLHSRYARKLNGEPDLAGCFELRSLKT